MDFAFDPDDYSQRAVAGAVVMQPGMSPMQPMAVPIHPMPAAAPMMVVATPIPGVPPGLEYLAQVNKIIVEQLIDQLEVFTGVECRNKYKLLNALGQQVYFAGENSHCCNRSVKGADRAFVMHILDNVGQEVIRVLAPQPLKCICLGRYVDVEAPVGNLIGRLKQTKGRFGMDLLVYDHMTNPVYKITFPCCSCARNKEFEIQDLNTGVKIGSITKFQGNLLKELYTNADTFGVDFPLNLDCKMKATLLAATFLIDCMFFEENQKNQNQKY